jgi:hypothetical protein
MHPCGEFDIGQFGITLQGFEDPAIRDIERPGFQGIASVQHKQIVRYLYEAFYAEHTGS